MALTISTRTGGVLTGLQHRAAFRNQTVNYNTGSIQRDGKILKASSDMLVTIKGGSTNTLSIAPGYAIVSGVLVENTSTTDSSLSGKAAGNYYLLLQVNMSGIPSGTPSATFVTQTTATTRITDNLTSSTSGTHDFILASFTYSGGASGTITNLVPVRPAIQPDYAEAMTRLNTATPPKYVWQLVDINMYKPYGIQTIESTATETLDISTRITGYIAPSDNTVTLPKGYVYFIEGNPETNVYGMNFYFGTPEHVEVSGGVKGYSVPASNASAFSATPCRYVVDLTNASSNYTGVFYGQGVVGSALMTLSSHFTITQYLKVRM